MLWHGTTVKTRGGKRSPLMMVLGMVGSVTVDLDPPMLHCDHNENTWKYSRCKIPLHKVWVIIEE